MDALWQDLRYGVRTLRARPVFTLVAARTLALGVGANTAIFSAVNALLLRPLPIEDVDRVVFGMACVKGSIPWAPRSSSTPSTATRPNPSRAAGSGRRGSSTWSRGGAGAPPRAAVMASYLGALGVRPVLGRAFTDEEDRSGGPAVALVGHDLWQRRFGGDAGLVGRALDLEGGRTPSSA